ncbi:uncharacterized protein [Amphiura filiformis]|uniref:uncharacterized protein n=1 Tax=Amphiura filiformis TaxID=82378 RepID=UPI003B20D8DF
MYYFANLLLFPFSNTHSEYKVQDIATRLGGIQIGQPNPSKYGPRIPITITAPSWVTTSSTSTLNIRCSCGNVSQQASHGDNRSKIHSSSDDDSSSDDSDDEGLSLQKLLGILRARDRDGSGERGGRKVLGATLRNLVMSYSCGVDEVLSESDLMQMLNLITSPVSSVQEAALLTITKVCVCKANAERLIQWKTVKRLLVLLEDSNQPRVVPAVAKAIQQLISHDEYKDNWLEYMITDGLSTIVSHLHGQPSDEDTMIAMANLLSQLAHYFEMAVLMLDHCMYYIMAAWKSYNVLKGPMLSVFEKLLSHNEHTISAALDQGILHYTGIILKESDCLCQVSALKIYQQLSQSPYGLSALLEENKLTLALRVAMATHCREVRKLSLITLDKTQELGTPSQVKELLLQLAESLEQESIRSEANGIHHHNAHSSEKGLGSKRKQAEDRVVKGVQYINKLLVHCLHKEGKISLDPEGNVLFIGFKPNVDQYMCLSYATNCAFYIATLPVHRPRTRTSSNKLQAARYKKRHPNILTSQSLIENGALCLIPILHKYTTYLTSQGALPNLSQSQQSMQNRNLDVLYLKATMKLWQQQSLRTHKQMAAILDKGEVKFIQQILQVVEVLAKCSAEIWNQGVEDEIQEDLKRYQAWEGAGDVGTRSEPYHYVETIDQAFYASYAKSHNTSKVAWGDGKSGGVHRNGGSPKKTADRSQTSSKRKTLSWMEEGDLQLGQSTGGIQGISVQKKIRTQLFKTGICSFVGALLMCGDTQIQVSSLEILRCLSQPFSQDEVCEMQQKNNLAAGGLPKMQSKQSIAESLAERDRILSLVLQEMSSGTASVVKDALKTGQGHQTKTNPKSATHPKSSIRPSSAKYPSLSKVRPKSGNRPSSAKSAKNEYSTKQQDITNQLAPQLSAKEPIYWQCTMHMLEICGHHLVHMLKCEDVEVAKAAMLLLYDIVTFGEVIVHMKLGSLGIISVLMHIISQHADAKEFTLLGLMTLQRLVANEYRLKQLFVADGGKEFLEKMANTSQGAVRAHIDQFLSLISQSGPSLY